MKKKTSPNSIAKDKDRKIRKEYSAEEKIRIVLEGLKCDDKIEELCRRENLDPAEYYKWSKDFIEAGRKKFCKDVIGIDVSCEEPGENIQRILDAAPGGIAIVDKETAKPLLVNRATCEIFDIAMKDALKFDTRMLYGNSREIVIQLMRDGRILNMEVKLRKIRSGKYFWAIFSVIPFEYMKKKTFIISYNDISDIKEMQIELERAKKDAEAATEAKSAFLANMSHEIRTPMNAIIGLIHLVQKTELNKKQLNYLSKIERSSQSLLIIINDILDLSKIDSGKLSIENVEFNLEEVLNNVSSLITYKAHEKGLEIFFSISKEVPIYLIGDSLRLGQVINNIVGNAVKFTDKGEIIISVRLIESKESGYLIEFSVKDTGIGMSKDQVSRLFESFSQADTSTTRKYGGIGLGLAISRKLVAMMKGDIEIESEPGAGSTFSFVAEFGKTASVQIRNYVPGVDIRNMRILVCDDNRTAREILSETLESFSLKVSTVKSAIEAIEELESAKEQPYDLVLMDWKMPEIDGIMASKMISLNRTISKIPVIIMVTAYGKEEIIKEEDNIGIHGFLEKPISSSLLFNTIIEVFGKGEKRIVVPTLSANHHLEALEKIKGANILLVEDNDINQLVAVELLEQVGFNMSVANNGQEAFDKCRSVKKSFFNLILMDLQMPVMDGYSATVEIRKLSEYKTLPIIAMTADATSGTKERCLEVGMTDFINKPIDPAVVSERLIKWMRPKEVIREAAENIIPKIDNINLRLPKFRCFNIEEGLLRLGGNKELYLRLLDNFCNKNKGIVDEIRQAYSSGDKETAVRLVHTMKGNAGNLGMVEVQKASENLEAILAIDSIDPKVSFNEISEALEPLLGEVSEYFNERFEGLDSEFPEASGELNSEKLRELVSELIVLLENSYYSATEKIVEIMELPGIGIYTNRLNAVMKNVEKFDFINALSLIRKLYKVI